MVAILSKVQTMLGVLRAYFDESASKMIFSAASHITLLTE